MTAAVVPAPGVAAHPAVAILGASWWLVRRPGLLVPVAAACVLVALTGPVLDDGYGVQVLRGAGVLLACALVSSTDDPAGEVLAASPYPRWLRTTARVLSAALVVVTAWAAQAVLVEWRAPDVPVLGLGLEGLAFGMAGLGIGAGLRAWRDQHAPSYLAAAALLGLALITNVAPRWYALQQGQTWGPPWEAAQIRWAALLLVAAGVVGLALRDPLERLRR